MLSKKKKEYFKNLLEKWLDELLTEANTTVSDMTSHKENLPDPADRAIHASTVCTVKSRLHVAKRVALQGVSG